MKEIVICKHFVDSIDNKLKSKQIPVETNKLLSEGWQLENTFYSEGAVVFVLSKSTPDDLKPM
jgi:hypothetical protein